jgi:hypothetical protein
MSSIFPLNFLILWSRNKGNTEFEVRDQTATTQCPVSRQAPNQLRCTPNNAFLVGRWELPPVLWLKCKLGILPLVHPHFGHESGFQIQLEVCTLFGRPVSQVCLNSSAVNCVRFVPDKCTAKMQPLGVGRPGPDVAPGASMVAREPVKWYTFGWVIV